MRFIIKKTLGALLALQATHALADSGNLFHVTTSGAALGQPVSYTLCLTVNGKYPLSCQNYSTSNATLSIKTTTPGRTYHYAGMKINTPGFRYTGQGFRAITRQHLVHEVAASNYNFIGTVSDTQARTATVTPTGGGNTALSVSITDLALSISGLTLNGQASGQARTITITNEGEATATGLNIDYPTWPAGTTVRSNCGATLDAGATCVITVRPNTTPTSNCSEDGSAPTPGVITISADNAADVTSNVVVLNYGCIYQGGYLFAMTETANTGESIGGKVVAQEDQAPRWPNGVIWSSNGVGSAGANVSNDTIPGIAETSTADSSRPTYVTAQTAFNDTYANEDTFPFPSADSFSACNGRTDGACNSANILELYTTYITKYGIGAAPYELAEGPTTANFYAAGRCAATISNYSGWYLPAICEMGPDLNGFGTGCTAGTQNMVTNLSNLLGISANNGQLTTACEWGNNGLNSTNCLAGYYWSSTENSNGPHDGAWDQFFVLGGLNFQVPSGKGNGLGVRCVRALTP